LPILAITQNCPPPRPAPNILIAKKIWGQKDNIRKLKTAKIKALF